MNLSFPTLRQLGALTVRTDDPSETAQVQRLWSLLALFSLYAAALFVVVLVSDGPDIGCILMGIAGHVLYASAKTAIAWRDAAWLEAARVRVRRRQLARAV